MGNNTKQLTLLSYTITLKQSLKYIRPQQSTSHHKGLTLKRSQGHQLTGAYQQGQALGVYAAYSRKIIPFTGAHKTHALTPYSTDGHGTL